MKNKTIISLSGMHLLCNYNTILYRNNSGFALTYKKGGIMAKKTVPKSVKRIDKKPAMANPAPLGLMAFGITTVLLNLHNAEFISLGSMIIAMGIFYGGLAQIVAGIMEFKNNNTFGTLAFTSYGFFWLSFAAIFILPAIGWAPAASNTALGFYLLIWGLFTMGMFIATLKMNWSIRFVFGTLSILFVMLAMGHFLDSDAFIIVAGIDGIFCGLAAMYTGLAQVINETHKTTILQH